MRGLKWFIAGALAVPLVHQPVLAILDSMGFISRAAYSMEATHPFGVPAVISLSFWGGVWGLILLLVLGRLREPWLSTAAMLFGSIAPTLVAAFVVAPLKGQPSGGTARMAMAALLINAAWGLATAQLARRLEAWRATSRNSPA
jgi:hypothetical protein